MCWISKVRPIIRVAESDIPVEKVLRGDDGFVHSPVYTGHFWKLGVEYSVALGEPHLSKYDFGTFVVESGFHSCREISQDSYSWLSVSVLGNYEMFYHHFNEYIYSAVIPSGSRYYVNEHGEYVSDRLRIIGKKDCVINNLKMRVIPPSFKSPAMV